MTEQNAITTTLAPMAIQPRPKLAIFTRREDYPIFKTEAGDERIVMPLRDYRKFRGETSYWQFLFLISFVSVVGIALLAYFQPPIYVEKPFVVEKVVPTPVNTRCLVWCK